MHRLAVFASGSGTNAQRIAEYFDSHSEISIDLVLCNKPEAFVLERAKKLGIPARVFSAAEFRESGIILQILQEYKIDFIVLAGFLLLLPESLLRQYNRKIVNIHPALLPKYGGKGMYGMRVHEAVIAAGDTESGISIHFVNERYDEGDVIFQALCPVNPDDTPDTLAARIHQLEYRFYPEVIEKVVLGAAG